MFTRYSDKRKEYIRIKNLYHFFNTWIIKAVEGVDHQILLCRESLNSFINIDDKNTLVFNFAIMDLSRILQTNNEDLYKTFISIKKGDRNRQNENLYELIFSLIRCQNTMEHYRQRSDVIVARCRKFEDAVTSKIYKLKSEEDKLFKKKNELFENSVSNALSSILKSVASLQHEEVSKFITNFNEIRRMMHLDFSNKKGKENKIIYFYTRKKLELCDKQVLSDTTITSDLRSTSYELIASIKELTNLYRDIRKEINHAISELEDIKQQIIETQRYFNSLPFCIFIKWKEA